jgi:hypothetical protein
MDIVRCHYNVENLTCEVHHTQRMFKPSMRGARENEIGGCELMNVSQPLKRTRIHNASFITVKRDKDVNWISKFVVVFQPAHFPSPLSFSNLRSLEVPLSLTNHRNLG